jgi:dTDP-glucose 4,6-dehydratase
VTGGAGFIGSHLCEALLDRGADVVCLDNFLTGTPRNVAHLLDRPGFTLRRTDLVEFVHVPGPVDLVLHFASPASPIDYLAYPIQTLKVGGIGTWHALGLAKDKGARFLLASTSEVYGDPQVHPQPESYWGHVNPVGPRGVYDESKRYAEALTVAYRGAEGVDTAIVRLFNTYGPRMRPNDGRAIPTFVGQALRGEPVTVAGDGSQTRSVCYVDDTVRGILALAESDHPGPMNIGNPDERSVLQIAQDVIAATASRSRVEFIERPVDDPGVRRPDTRLAEQVLGWQPRVSWSEGLARTTEWFRSESALSA